MNPEQEHARAAAGLICLLGAVAALGNRLANAARAAAWTEVADLERERAALLGRVFAAPIPAPLTALVANTVRDALDVNRDVLARATAARDGLRGQVLDSRRGQRAKLAYVAA